MHFRHRSNAGYKLPFASSSSVFVAALLRNLRIVASKTGHSLHRQIVYFGTREGKSDKNLWKRTKRLAMVGIPSGLKSERKIRGTLKEASEKNNAFRRLKSRFEGSRN
ncbi:hypothetical protein AVEN_69193-1 [Araneus ventricosus]|uniref:Uncharacterized protein n=1 Tax=Araneus ventricosus TaxID=182803 RepID=A0A4Y2S7T2_ARAVE|nr:hypothetical protein AVEN_69193-1 [Araneus ventricosus]